MYRILIPVPFIMLALLVLPALRAEDKKEKPKFKLTDAEQMIFDMTNEARKKEKLPALKLSQILCEVARAHSANMAKQGKLSHELDGKKPPDRIKAAGYQAAWGGENVGASNDPKPENAIFKMWMESPLHKANILKDKYTELGIGIAKDENGETYITQVFATPKRKR